MEKLTKNDNAANKLASQRNILHKNGNKDCDCGFIHKIYANIT